MCSEPYHYSWLSSHPHRSEEWLAEKLRDGFDIHHLDGNHDNNEPENLTLIEHTDHMFLHGGRTMGRLRGLKTGTKPKKVKFRLDKPSDCSFIHGERAAGKTVSTIAKQQGLTRARVSLLLERHRTNEALAAYHPQGHNRALDAV